MIHTVNDNEMFDVGVHRSNAFLPSKIVSESIDDKLNNLYLNAQGSPMERELNFDNQDYNAQVDLILKVVEEMYFLLFPAEVNSSAHDAVKEINEFKRQFLFQDGESKFQRYRNLQMGRLYFSHVKDSIEKATILLIRARAGGDEQKAKHGIKDLIKYLSSCAPGVMEDLDHLVLQLSNNKNIVFWLSKLRSDIVDNYASIEIGRSNIPEIWEVHAHALFNVLAHQLKYQPSKPNIYDYHLSQLSVTPLGVVGFKKYFIQEYSAENIVSLLSENISKMIESVHSKYIPDANGWISFGESYSSIVEEIEKIVSALDTGAHYPGNLLRGYNPPQAPNLESLCELSDDSSKIRIRHRGINEMQSFLVNILVEQGVFTKYSDCFFNGAIGVSAEMGILPEMTDKEKQFEIEQSRVDALISTQITNPEDIFSSGDNFIYNEATEHFEEPPSFLPSQAGRYMFDVTAAQEMDREDQQRLAEERRREAEQQKLAEEHREAEQQRLAAERREAEQERLAEEHREAEQERLAAEHREVEQERLAAEHREAEQERLAAEHREAEQERLAAEHREAEQQRLTAERRTEQKKAEDDLKKRALVYYRRQNLVALSICTLSSIAVIYATGFLILPCIVSAVIYFSWMIRANKVIREQYGCEIVQENIDEKLRREFQEAREAMKPNTHITPAFRMFSQTTPRRDTKEAIVCGEDFPHEVQGQKPPSV